MDSICGANCSECSFNKKCNGCKKSNGCPFGKKCFIAKYIEIGGKDSFNLLKKKLIDEINSFLIDGLPKINELYPLNGSIVNLEYNLPNGNKVKYLDDDSIYLANQVESIFDNKTYYGIVVNMDFLLISRYDENYNNKELVLYYKR